MGKKNKIDIDSSEKRGKKGKPLLSFLNVEFGNVDLQTVKRHLLILILASLLTKFIVIFATTSVFHSFIDLFDIGYYFECAIKLVQGQIPYVSYNFEYPILIFIPITIAIIPVLLFQNAMAFVYTFKMLMVLCDTITILCIYFIGLKLWNEKTAFYAGLIFATAFSTAYFVQTKYDAFPTCLMMLAILFTVYDMNTRGYISSSLGFFTKIFPIIVMPFIVLYNAKTTSLKQEILSAGKIFLLFVIVLLLPLAIINPDVIRSYLIVTGGSLGIYAATPTFTLYSILHDVLHTEISSSLIATVMQVLMGVTLIILVYIAYIAKEKDPKQLLKLVLCAIFALVFFAKFHSPQYFVWFTPFLALLVADDLVKIFLFYVTQIFVYIEFPLTFGSYWVNLNYTNPVGTTDWYLTLLFFTLQYLAFLLLISLIIRPPEGIFKKIRSIRSGN